MTPSPSQSKNEKLEESLEKDNQQQRLGSRNVPHKEWEHHIIMFSESRKNFIKLKTKLLDRKEEETLDYLG